MRSLVVIAGVQIAFIAATALVAFLVNSLFNAISLSAVGDHMGDGDYFYYRLRSSPLKSVRKLAHNLTGLDDNLACLELLIPPREIEQRSLG